MGFIWRLGWVRSLFIRRERGCIRIFPLRCARRGDSFLWRRD